MYKLILSILLLLPLCNAFTQDGIEHVSMITTQVLLLKGNKVVSQGTGFYVAQDNTIDSTTILYLVTNYHVLTGYGPLENKEPIGDNIVFYFHNDKSNTGKLKQIRLPLFTKRNDPIWISNKIHNDADVAIIPIPANLYKDCQVFCITDKWTISNIKLHPTSRVTLVGYPYGLSDTINSLPIWKTGSIASEPNTDFNGKPLIVVDVSAFPGMSGSPAFAISYGMYEMEEGGTTAGNVQKFLGIFASMQMRQEKKYLEELQSDKKSGMIINESLQLGHVWKASLIFDMIKTINVKDYVNNIVKYL